ncbi:MAG: acetyl-CoA carboxylase biotin carboxyl carrier protein [Candidatus Algichlamydia australiensis]|nr:acetyl-CoA carboxylase biotin carboxyl carrier protein [Chlamydiales bacterium]
MDLDLIKKIVAYMEESSLSKIRYKDQNVEIELERSSGSIAPLPQPQAVHHQPVAASAPAPAPLEAPKAEESGQMITSPMVGTYYSSPAPDQPAFVKVGDHVTEETVVCIIEAMKVMNEVKAGVKGTVKKILVASADPVEFGTALIEVDPA